MILTSKQELYRWKYQDNFVKHLNIPVIECNDPILTQVDNFINPRKLIQRIRGNNIVKTQNHSEILNIFTDPIGINHQYIIYLSIKILSSNFIIKNKKNNKSI